MSKGHWLLRAFGTAGLILTLSIGMNACGTSTTTWKEEVLLHDGSKILITRSQTRAGRHEIGQGLPIKEHTVIFNVPGSEKTISWSSDDQEFNGLGLHLFLLDFLDGQPYIATHPSGYLVYNKWGRPNPPYVLFKYDGEWKRISMQEFPVQFKQPNVVISTYEEEKIKAEQREFGFVSINGIKKLNSGLKGVEYHSIIRTPINYGPLSPKHSGAMAPVSPPDTNN